MDRGYDDNKMFLKLDELKQDYVFRLTAKRKLFPLENGFLQRSFGINGKAKSKRLWYTKENAMMLATNKEIKSKEDVINVAKTYFSRWRIEEYFRCKKQMFRFENFRVRKLKRVLNLQKQNICTTVLLL